ncbi:hypothetical protein DERP_012188 [Dermatophagoides pteronyssinus]|uniref:Uncharacterized protein n=1 Tax=Dermatophagoides pteronyssinus TaxID=6956 RepID=A0ABQ8J2D6_DERPT|nr:hypothetical protein DERP_012188 [Dermatophagoides pteronyssinus]
MFGEICMDMSKVRSLLFNDVASAAVAANGLVDANVVVVNAWPVEMAEVVVDVVVIVGDIDDADAPMVIDTDKDNGLVAL